MILAILYLGTLRLLQSSGRGSFLIPIRRYDQPKFLEEDMRSTFLKWHRDAELFMMDCGHCPMQEMPIHLQTLMENFLKKHAG